MTDTTDDQHERQLAQCSSNLWKLAMQLCQDYPDFGMASFGKAFMTTALGLLVTAVGPDVAARWLRELADDVESGKATTLNRPQ